MMTQCAWDGATVERTAHGVLTGCGDSEAPTTDSKVPTDEPQEPMDTGPMANDGQATRESTGDGVSDPE